MSALDGKVAVITGAASGIGAATARLFVSEGAKVVIADVRDDEGEKLAADLGAAAVYAHTDVTSEAEVKRAVDGAVERFGRLDVLFNNAGYAGVDGAIEETDTVKLDETISVLFRGVVLGIKYAAPIMKRQGKGSIINTASVAGIQAGRGPHVYSALKAAVAHLSKSVAMELGESGIRVNSICPGAIVTPIFGRSFGLSEDQTRERTALLNEIFTMIQPIRRAGQPEDIANAALFLASDRSEFVNGHALVVDGGLTGGPGWTEGQMLAEQVRQLMGAPPRE